MTTEGVMCNTKYGVMWRINVINLMLIDYGEMNLTNQIIKTS